MKKLASAVLTLVLLLSLCAGACAEGELKDIRYLYSTDSFDPLTDYTRTLIAEELGVNVIPEMYSSADQITMILGSDQTYDAVKITDTALLATYAQAHVVTDLTDLVKANEAFYNLYPQEIWDKVTVDGRIYAIPESDTEDIEWGIAVRTDWLEKCGLGVPTTVDEFYDMLVAFSQLDPAEVGVDYIIPFSAPGVNTTLGFNGLIQAFGLGGNIQEFVPTEEGLKCGYNLPGGKEYLTFLNKLYAEGLLDADFPSNTNSTVCERFAAGNVGAAVNCCWDSWTRDTLMETFEGADMTYIGGLKKEGFEENGRIYTRGGLKNYLVVPTSSDKAQDVVDYCIGFMDDAHYTRLILGDLDVHYSVDSGTYYPIFPAFDEMNKGRWFYPTNVGAKYTPLFAVRAHKELSMGILWDRLNAFKETQCYLDLSKYCPLLPAYSTYYSALTSLSNEYLIRMILDENELDGYDEFVASWMASGGQAWTDEMNQWYASTH